MWMFAGLFIIPVITSAAAQSCPANQIASEAQIIHYGDRIVPESAFGLPAAGLDTNLTYFREVLGYSEDEIQQEVQNALQFFSERFGLDFSPNQPNELGLRFFQNATLQPIRRPSQINAILNRWILTGNTRSKCFPSVIGGFLVTFSGEQILKGTYGGEEGIDVPNGTILAYEYLSISVPPCEPVVIQRRSPIPVESIRIGVTLIFYELSHRTLGQGSQQGFVQVERLTATNGTSFLRLVGSSVLTFPPNILTFN